jgi:hypothetical protein
VTRDAFVTILSILKAPSGTAHLNAGFAPLAPWAKSARKAAKFTQWRPAPGTQRGADPTGLGLKGSPARSSVKRVEWRSHSGSRANQKSPASVHEIAPLSGTCI